MRSSRPGAREVTGVDAGVGNFDHFHGRLITAHGVDQIRQQRGGLGKQFLEDEVVFGVEQRADDRRGEHGLAGSDQCSENTAASVGASRMRSVQTSSCSGVAVCRRWLACTLTCDNATRYRLQF